MDYKEAQLGRRVIWTTGAWIRTGTIQSRKDVDSTILVSWDAIPASPSFEQWRGDLENISLLEWDLNLVDLLPKPSKTDKTLYEFFSSPPSGCCPCGVSLITGCKYH